MIAPSLTRPWIARLAAAIALMSLALPARAQVPDRGNLVITGSASPNPAASGGQVTYTATISNDSTVTALGVKVGLTLPTGPDFIRCTPSVNVPCALVVTAGADRAINGEEPRHGDGTIVATAVSDLVSVTMLPSLRTDVIGCGSTIGSSFFQPGETTMRLNGSMGCAHSSAAIRIAADAKTFDLNKFKIVGAATDQVKDSVGIAGVDLVSSGASLRSMLVDIVVPGTASTTNELPGGIGIHASGDISIKDTIVRRTTQIGIWLDGSVDANGNHRVGSIDGNLATSRVEVTSGVGILHDGALHVLKNTYVEGDGDDGVSTTGVWTRTAPRRTRTPSG